MLNSGLLLSTCAKHSIIVDCTLLKVSITPPVLKDETI
jgi:hypothetical protein